MLDSIETLVLRQLYIPLTHSTLVASSYINHSHVSIIWLSATARHEAARFTINHAGVVVVGRESWVIGVVG